MAILILTLPHLHRNPPQTHPVSQPSLQHQPNMPPYIRIDSKAERIEAHIIKQMVDEAIEHNNKK